MFPDLFIFTRVTKTINPPKFVLSYSRKILTNINCTIMSNMSGLRSILGALVKFSWMYLKVPAALRKASTAWSKPRADFLSCFAPSCVYKAPALKRTDAFSKATVR